MFLDELTPFVEELTRQPVAFLGGFVSGILRLNLSEDPVRGWLEKQNVSVPDPKAHANGSDSNNGPQKISID
ncbi:MAG: hypothetical protein F6J95_024570 [Leptolyngbya sp. SIO1E4]|nr:hypothetical protein [Leptolyngbya sp. SIO1E4]